MKEYSENIYFKYTNVIIRFACLLTKLKGDDWMSLILLEQLKPQISEQLQNIVDLRDSL